MSLTQRLSEYVRACFTGIWIESHEHQDALMAIAQLSRQEEWRLASWNIEQGLNVPGIEIEAGDADPLAAIRSIGSLATPDGTVILVLQNFHRFMQSAEIVQALIQQVVAGKQNRTFIVILAPVVQIPVELEKLFVVLEHELPDREQLAEIAESIATEAGELPSGSERETILDAAVGLTRYEAEAAFSLSLVRIGQLAAETLWEQKAQMLKKSGLLSLYRGGHDFSSLGGLSALKAFCKRALLQPSRDNPLKRPRGVLLLSPPGCGKSQFCKSLGAEVGRPVLVLDVGSLMGSLVGQSEERTRQALRIIDAMAPCVVMIDEVEKAFAGVGGSGQTDSGVSARMFGAFLSWLNDHESDVFVVCTANNASKLPPEFGRSERFDGIFFLDLPGRQEKDAIWGMVPALAPFNYNQPDGEPLLRGLAWEVVERLDAADGFYGLGRHQWWKLFDKEIAKQVFERMVLDAGVRLRYFTFFHTVEMEGPFVRRAFTVSKRGLEAWNAKLYIDASGDGDLAAAAGAPVMMGGVGDRMPPTYCFTVMNVDRALLGDARRVNEAMQRGKAEGRLRNPDDHRGEKDIFGPHAMVFNYNHIYDVDCLDADDLTRGVVEGRDIAFELIDYLRETVPGFEQSDIAATGVLLGVRETRRIEGDFVLEADAYFESHRHDDDICVYDYALDLHAARPSKDSQEDYYDIYYDRRTKSGEFYGIPYRSLLPKNLDNVAVAGRCISVDRPMLGSVRQLSSSLAMGQAAGAAAAMALQRGNRYREVAAGSLQAALRDDGAYIP